MTNSQDSCNTPAVRLLQFNEQIENIAPCDVNESQVTLCAQAGTHGPPSGRGADDACWGGSWRQPMTGELSAFSGRRVGDG